MKLSPYFNILAYVPRARLKEALNTARQQSQAFRDISSNGNKVYSLMLGNDGHQGYYLEWFVILELHWNVTHSHSASYL